MNCSKCNSNNVNIQREQIGTIGGAHTYGKKHHTLVYYLFFSWWIWIFKLLFKVIFLPLTMWFGKRDKLNTITAQKTFNKTVAICQNCGHSWKV